MQSLRDNLLAGMYSMDDLLHLVHSDGADRLMLHIGRPPVIVLDGEEHEVEGPAIMAEEAEHLFQSIANTRQRRALRQRGFVQFMYRFRNSADFVVLAKMEEEGVRMDIH